MLVSGIHDEWGKPINPLTLGSSKERKIISVRRLTFG